MIAAVSMNLIVRMRRCSWLLDTLLNWGATGSGDGDSDSRRHHPRDCLDWQLKFDSWHQKEWPIKILYSFWFDCDFAIWISILSPVDSARHADTRTQMPIHSLFYASFASWEPDKSDSSVHFHFQATGSDANSIKNFNENFRTLASHGSKSNNKAIKMPLTLWLGCSYCGSTVPPDLALGSCREIFIIL